MTFLETRNVHKNFGPVQALRGVDLIVDKGEIHALLGENGAGKTTLMNLLYGLLSPDSGSMRLEGNLHRPRSPRDAVRAGVGMVHQHFMLVPTLTVLENILLGESPLRYHGKNVAASEVESRMREFTFDLPLDCRVQSLSVGVQQRVEIFKALRKGARLLILDEPTAVLAPQEIEDLFRLLRNLREIGHSILFISHKLEEIQNLCDRVTLLRRGETVGTFDVSRMNKQELAHHLLGRTLNPRIRKQPPAQQGASPYFIQPKSRQGKLKGDWTCVVEPGQIVAVAGIEGNGQRELAEAILGVSETDQADIERNGLSLPKDAFRRVRHGVGLISEDRQRTGLILEFSIQENLALKDIELPPWSRKGWLRRRSFREAGKNLVERFRIEPPDPDRGVSELSGGNQQKVVVAREISRNHKLLVAFNPTRGLDVGACENVHEALLEDAARGAAILLISTELEEVLALADKLYVLFQGCLEEIPPENWTSEQLGLAMLGEDRSERS